MTLIVCSEEILEQWKASSAAGWKYWSVQVAELMKKHPMPSSRQETKVRAGESTHKEKVAAAAKKQVNRTLQVYCAFPLALKVKQKPEEQALEMPCSVARSVSSPGRRTDSTTS